MARRTRIPIKSKELFVSPKEEGELSSAFETLGLSTRREIHGNTQMMRVAYAVQHPYEHVDPSRSVTATDLLLAIYNTNVCPVGTDPRADAVVKKRPIGRGSNAEIWLVDPPSNAQQLGLGIQLGVVLKENLVAISVYDPRRELGLSLDIREQQMISRVPCWDPTYRAYRCRIEPETEVLISSLTSKLFTDGISPSMLVQVESFTCDDPSNEGKLFMLQELVGLPSSGWIINSLERLPEFLHFFHDTAEGTNIIYPNKFVQEIRQNAFAPDVVERIEGYGPETYPPILREEGKALLRQISTNVLISVLHTIAVLQSSFRIVSLDTKLSNILIKVFDEKSYFRNTVVSPNRIWYFRYDFVNGGKTKSFWLPNLGWIPKIADFGMSMAFRVPYVDRDNRLSYTSIGFYAYLADRFPEIQRRYQLAATVVKDPSANVDTLAKIAEDIGYPPEEALSLAEQAKDGLLNSYILEYKALMDNRRLYGIHEEFSPGYDPHLFVASFGRSLRKWLEQSIDNPTSRAPYGYLPISFLQEKLGYVFPQKSTKFRPAYDEVSQHGPQSALSLLHDIGTGEYVPKRGEELKVQHVKTILGPMVQKPYGIPEDQIMIISVPIEPIL
jgi:serine/threonine protein kinase